MPAADSTPGGLRKRRSGGFVQIPSHTMRDKELSYRARGVLGWILDHPDGWDVRSDVIAAEGTEGREAVRTALRELAARGYYRIERRRLRDGRYETVTAVSDVAVPVWAEEHKAAMARAGKRKDGSDAAPRPRVYVENADGEWVPATHQVEEPPAADPPGEPADGLTGAQESTPTEDGFPGFGLPGFGSPGAGNLGPPLQTETQTESEREGVTSGGIGTSVDVRDADAPLEPDAELRPAPPGRCRDHLARPASAPCPPCGDARRALERWEADRAARVRVIEDREREAQRRRRDDAAAEVAACRLCDADGVPVGVDLARCTHDDALNRSTVAARHRARSSLRENRRTVPA